jgi:hypothetical protein
VLGTHFSRFYPEESARRFRGSSLRLRAARRVETEGWRVRKNGERFWARVVITALHERDRSLARVCHITQDLSDGAISSRWSKRRNVGDFIAVSRTSFATAAPIRNAAQLMARLPAIIRRKRSMREMIERQTGQLARIVDDIWTWRASPRALSPSSGWPWTSTACSTTPSRRAAADRGAQASPHRRASARRATINGDAHRITQVLVNL